ncbi:UNVERIFIED_CONTAM: Retrovirus-related Pol polyprotein from transposon TNT 1-94 [Sesamum calycinum]|uniref:Retrovirus-related Pol polyprotein from transposon TNT 1-94 n=1 Tax=Sesamum calycinum TaxID=2727403 RepID=A0AAW2T1L7_9LAMI
MSSLAKQISVPIFSSQNYDYWAIKMKTYFQSQTLWEIVEEGVILPEDSSTSSSAEKGKLENKKAKDSEALYYIQTAVADHIFPRISVATSAKEAWSILQRNIKAVQRLKGNHQANCIEENNSSDQLFYTCNSVAEIGEATWYIDSAASNHMTYNKGAFQTLDESFKTNVKLGDNHIVKVEGKGSVAINTKKGTRIINDVMYIPNLRTNLFSVGQMMEKGYTLHFGGDSCTIYDNKDKTLKIAEVRMKEHRCFPIHLQYMGRTAMKAQEDQSWLWHRRLGHFNFQGLKILHQKKMMTDLPQIQAVEGACEACLQGKQHKKPFPSGTSWRAKAVLELIHTDVCGPMRTPSHEQNRYFILFIDDYSRMTWVYFMREKSEVFKEKHLPKAFWAEAVYTAVYLLNSICYVHIPTEKRHKLEEKTEKGIFLGYTQSKGYRIYNLKTKKLIISRDVEFDEDAMWNWDEEKVERQSVMIPKETPPQQQQEEGTDQAEMERRSQQAPGSPRRPPPSSEEIEEETPPRRQSFSVIYEKHATSSCWNQRILKPL